jgi:hypothetical protein
MAKRRGSAAFIFSIDTLVPQECGRTPAGAARIFIARNSSAKMLIGGRGVKPGMAG